MRLWRKASVGLLITVLALVTVLAACSSKSSNGEGSSSSSSPPPSSGASAPPSKDAQPSAWQLGSEPLTFSAYADYGWMNLPPWGQDVFTKAIKDKFKVDIKTVAANGNAETKLNTMIVSKDLPDVVWGDRERLAILQDNDMLVPLDPYLEKYPNLKKWAGDRILNALRADDGKLYMFPNWYTSKPTGNAGYVVNKKIYEALGKPPLETTDDLYNYLKLVKQKYPNITPLEPGQASEGKGVDILYSAFRENNPATHMGTLRAVPMDGKLTSIFADPAFKEAMIYVNKLYREKLMTQDALTQKAEQVTERVRNGRAAVYVDIRAIEEGEPAHQQLKSKDPNDGYFMIWPIHKPGLNKENIKVAHYAQIGWNAAAITKKAKEPEKIFAFLDWMTGEEGTRELIWGPEGMYWEGTDENGVPIWTENFATDMGRRLDNMKATIDWQLVGNAVFNDQIKLSSEQQLPDEARSWATKYQGEITWPTHIDYTTLRNIEPPNDSEEGVIREKVIELYKKARAQAILAKSEEEVSKIIDQAEIDAQKLGYQKVLDYMTKKWKENEAKINGK